MGAPRKTSDPYRSAAALWGALARRFRDSCADRNVVPVPPEELAERVGYSRQTIYAIENGDHVAGDRAKAALWDETVGAGGVLLMLWPLASQLGTTPLRDYLARREAAYAGQRRRSSASQEEDRVERRQLLQLALAGLGAGPLAAAGEPVRQLIERAISSTDAAASVAVAAAAERDLADWDLVCADHMHAVLTRPPAQVIPDLVVDLLALERRLDTADQRTAPDLHGFAARLSGVHANALTRLGDHGSALRWWRTARTAAATSGNLELELSVRGAEAIFGLYGQRAPHTVIKLTETAKRMAGDRPSAGLARSTGAHAQALALAGRHEEARRELRLLEDLVGRLESKTGEFGWGPDGRHFVASWVHSLGGDETAAGGARERVIGTLTPGEYQNATNVHLHEALVMVAAGGVNQGVRRAAEVIDDLPAPYRSHMITETGRLVLRNVPVGKRGLPAVKEFHRLVLTHSTG